MRRVTNLDVLKINKTNRVADLNVSNESLMHMINNFVFVNIIKLKLDSK